MLAGQCAAFVVGAILLSDLAVAADSKIMFNRQFRTATEREKYAADIVVRSSGGMIPADHFDQALVLSTRWFSRRGAKDVFFRVQGNRLDYPSLCILMSLEDESLQYAGCVSMDGRAFWKRARGANLFPDLITRFDGRAHRWRWTGNSYEPI